MDIKLAKDFKFELQHLPFANYPEVGTENYQNRPAVKFLALHRLITLDFLPFSNCPNEGVQNYNCRPFLKFLALHRLITMDFLPFRNLPYEGQQFRRERSGRV